MRLLFPSPNSTWWFLGTPATTSQMAKDVVTFLSWAAEPEHDERKKLGIKAVIIFSTLFVMSIYVKRFKWGPIKNRKISESSLLMLWDFLTDDGPSLQTSRRHSLSTFTLRLSVLLEVG